MANPWFRVWTDMVTDPKWRTIARVSGQSIGDVIATYLHMMTCASNACERGRTHGWTDEDVATALDINTEQITAIRAAMQGRVLDGDYLAGWEKRQPAREDGSADRAKAFRDSKKLSKDDERTQTNANERKRTLEEKRGEEIRLDTNSNELVVPNGVGDSIARQDCQHQKIIELYHDVLPMCPKIRDWTPARAVQLRARWNEDSRRQNLDYWRQFFEYVATCDFLVGKSHSRDRKPFFADLEWIVRSANFTKIREGKYANCD